mgnify:CR=1 FL=1
MLGYILYETVDILYHTGKLTVNGVTNIYNWYYDIQDESTMRDNVRIQMLEKRLEELEDKIREKQ